MATNITTHDSRARHPRRAEFIETKLRLLESLYDSGPGTIDRANQPDQVATKFPGCGPWRGGAVLSLKADRLIAKTGEWDRSKRKFRHGGENRVWVLVDAIRAALTIQRLRQALGLPLRTDLQAPNDLFHG